jgi:hypothetical protein
MDGLGLVDLEGISALTLYANVEEAGFVAEK